MKKSKIIFILIAKFKTLKSSQNTTIAMLKYFIKANKSNRTTVYDSNYIQLKYILDIHIK